VGWADIKDGKFDTAAAGGGGVVAGPVLIGVEGMDPTPPPGASEDVSMTVLFPRYEVAAELPEGSSTKDIDVPAEAAKEPVMTGEAVHVGP
jgi:hypothetical protein